MSYKVVSSSKYPFRRESAKFFSQELIEYVLFDFGHIWKPERSEREIQLRKVSMFIFVPCIGRLVAYISRKYSGFVVMKCFKTWIYVNSHRPCIKERLLCNEIVTVCTRHELEEDDLGLFTFLAITAEYARLAVNDKQEKLVNTVVDALSYCLTSKLQKGFISTLERLRNRASNFDYPRNYVVYDYNPSTQFVTPVSTDSVYTPRSEFESPIMLEFHLPTSLYNTPEEDIITELKNRKVHRELFRRKMMTDRATQIEVKNDQRVNQLRCVVFRCEITDLAEKVNIENDNFNTPMSEATFEIVQTSDVSVQTWSAGGQFDALYAEAKITEEQHSKDVRSVRDHALDLNAVIEKLKFLENIQINDLLPGSSHIDVKNLKGKKPEKREVKNVTENLSRPLSVDTTEFRDSDTDKHSLGSDDTHGNSQEGVEKIELQCVSEMEASSGASFNDSQFESLDVSTDDPTKVRHKKDDSFDSQIGSLDGSILTSDESRLEN